MLQLPLARQLDASQAAVVQLTPHWIAWTNEAVLNKRISPSCAQSTRLEAYNTSKSKPSTGGKLILSCDHAANATVLKQQQQSIIDFLNLALQQACGRSQAKENQTNLQIAQLVIRLRHRESITEPQNKSQAQSQPRFDQATYSAINEAITGCQKLSKNEALINSLERLAKTLRTFQR